MSSFQDEPLKCQGLIREILLREWDPIGITELDDGPEAQDEYDHYLPEIYLVLASHEPRERLIDHLWWIETSQIGLFGNRERIEIVADHLIGLRDRLEGEA